MDRGLLIRELPDHERPRERLLLNGADALKPSELIAILLRTGTRGVSALDMAQELLQRFGGSLDRLSRAEIRDLQTIKGIEQRLHMLHLRKASASLAMLRKIRFL